MIFGRGGNQADRDAAIALVRNAAAAGRITSLDRDHRIRELQHADTAAEIDVHIRDLRLPSDPHGAGMAAATSAPVASSTPATYPPPPQSGGSYGDPAAMPQGGQQLPQWVRQAQVSSQSANKTAKRGLVAGCVFVVLMMAVPVVVAGFMFVSLTDIGEDSSGGPTVIAEPVTQSAESLTPRGYRDLVAALQEETGSTEVFRAVLYPDYASVDVAVDATTGRYRSWYWNGDLRETGSPNTTSSGRVDLADIDPRVFARLLKRAERGVEDPTARYLIIQGSTGSQPATLMAYANNGFKESSHVRATLEGKILR